MVILSDIYSVRKHISNCIVSQCLAVRASYFALVHYAIDLFHRLSVIAQLKNFLNDGRGLRINIELALIIYNIAERNVAAIPQTF